MARGSNVLEIIINGTNRAGPAFKQAAVQATRMGAAVSAAFAAATVRAGQFEKGLAEISTLLDGDVTQSIRQIRGELLDLSTEFGQSIGKMTKARYDVISAGFTDAAESATVLRSASKLAVAGVSDVAVAADLLTSALGGLQLEADESERVINVLFQTVRKGKTTLDQLGQGLGKVFGTAKTAGVSLELLGAAMATATASGVQTREAVTGLNALMLALAAPTEEARKALEDAGISMEKGFLQALIDVNKAAGDSPAKLRELIPSIEALRVASVIAGNIGLMTENLDEMNRSAGVVDDGVAKMAQTFDFQLQRAKRSLDALVIEIGTAFLPAATEMLESLNALAKGFREGDTDIQAAAKTIGKWALGVTAAGAALSLLSTTVTIVGPAIAAMGAAFIASSVPVQVAVVAITGLIVALIKYRKEIEEKLFPMARKFNEESDKTPGVLDRVGGALKQLGARAAGEKLKESATQMKLLALWGEQLATGLGGLRGPLNNLWQMQAAAEDASREMIELSESPEAIDDAFTEGLGKTGETVKDEMAEIQATVEAHISQMIARIQESFNAMVRLQKKAEEIVFVPEPPGPRMQGPEEGEGGPITDETVEKTDERIQKIKEQLESLAEFAAEDFMDMAFNIGSAFANVATQIASHLFGLTKGPLMLGRAFKQMAVSILSDLAQIIARMLVARALLAAFGGGGFFGSALGKLAGNNTGSGVVPTAATGYSVPGGTGQFFPPIILPGSSGLDRRPILAAGGEAVISKPHVNAMQAALKQPMTSPGRDRLGGRGGRRGMKIEMVTQVSRPFNRSEQTDLTDSVTEAVDRSARYGS